MNENPQIPDAINALFTLIGAGSVALLLIGMYFVRSNRGSEKTAAAGALPI